MTLTPELLTAMIIAGTALVTSMGAVAVNIIMASKVTAVKNDVAEVKTQAAVIAGHVNSEQTAGKGREAVLRKENDLLREVLEENKRASALLAQSVVTTKPIEHTTTSALSKEVGNGKSASASLEKIEVYTEETAKNTAKTDASITKMEENK